MIESIPYVPEKLVQPKRLIDVPTAWREVMPAVEDMLDRFCPRRNMMLELGVDYGYSIAVFANYFKDCWGVDTFQGDGHAGYRDNLFSQTVEALKGFDNIMLIQDDVKGFMDFPHTRFDLIHVDLFHVFDLTYEVGMWAVEHSNCVLFHDTIAFPEVKLACARIAEIAGRKFYEYQVQHGVGILVKE